MKALLIVEDDVTLSLMLQKWLTKKGFHVKALHSTAKAKQYLEQEETPDLILSDLRLPEEDGLSLLHWTRERGYTIPFLIMTGYADVPGAVQAMKEGAYDYISKPMQPDLLLQKINEALNRPLPQAEQPFHTAIKSTDPASLPATPQAHPSEPTEGTDDFLEGNSPQARELYRFVSLVAPTDMSVLIRGASGTGKEYVAHRIHQLSPRHDKPFIAIDCGAIPRDLAASEFFGHVKGAFTGALADKTGAFAQANGGTLFLDEIGNLDYETQQRLLRALQERKIRPVGSEREITVDVRLVSATNEDLESGIEKGTFREDVYHRINEFTLKMPTLCQRPEDIPLFARFFLRKAGRELQKEVQDFSPEALHQICQYPWPGNLRQMKNLIKRAVLLAETPFVTPQELGEELNIPTRKKPASTAEIQPLRSKETEKEQILHTLQQTGNNKSLAARLLGIDRKTLYNKMKQYGIQ